jgi:hypothetical protein
MELQIFEIFPTPILKFNMGRDFTKEEIEFIIEKEKDITPPPYDVYLGNNTTISKRILEEPVMVHLKSIAEGCLKEWCKQVYDPLYGDEFKLKVTQSWLNYTKPGEFHHKHSHPNSLLSGVFYFNADKEKDIHSPVVYGKWQAFLGWLNFTSDKNNTINVKYAIDLLRKPNFIWFHNNYYRLLFGFPLLVALFDWRLAFAAFYLPTFISLIQDNGVNVFGHIKGLIGYRNFDTNDFSQNNAFFGYLGWGQGWHNNHHAKPANYDFGSGTSGKWWEFDPCRLFLPFLGRKRINK